MTILRDVPISLTPEEVLQAQCRNQPTNSSSERKDKRYLTVGPRVDLLAPARLVMVAVYTIGPAVEKRVSELHAVGEDLLAFMLDSVGVLALGAIGEALRDRVEKRWPSPTTLMWRTLWGLWLVVWCSNCGRPSAR